MHLKSTNKVVKFEYKTGFTDLYLKLLNPGWTSVKSYLLEEKNFPVSGSPTGVYEATIPAVDLDVVGDYFLVVIRTGFVSNYYKLEVSDFDLSIIYDILQNDKRVIVYDLYTDENDVDIIFSFPRALDPSDIITVKLYQENTELFSPGFVGFKVNGRMASFNTVVINDWPNEPINIIMKAITSITGQTSCAILQYKNRATESPSNVYQGSFGKIIL